MHKFLIWTLLSCFCLGMSSVFAQDSNLNSTPEDSLQQNRSQLQQAYLNYFKFNREAVYLHLNKTALIPGEALFFAAYAYDPRTTQANLQTTNLNVGIYNNKGERVNFKVIHIENGFGAGQFKLNPKRFGPGKYMIAASTHYMQNFAEELVFKQSFRILDTVAHPEQASEKEYDLQLLPEGGHIVMGALNNVGLKLIDNSGEGVFFTKGRLYDQNGNIITRFESNRFGLSRFTFTPRPDKNYYVKLHTTSGKTLREPVKNIEAYGIALAVNALLPENIYVTIRTNRQTFHQEKNAQYLLAIHRQGVLTQIPFQISPKTLEKSLKIDRGILATGVNILTIFKVEERLIPVAERMIFNDHGLERAQIEARMVNSGKHGGELQLFGKNFPSQHQLSVSVLPYGTKAYSPRHSILSAFYLKPYVKGIIENASYYFKRGKERQRDYNLDLLLMTQGWSQFDWNRIFNHPPTEKFEYRNGFTLKGNIQGDNAQNPENSSIILKSSGDILRYASLTPEKSFRFENVYLKDTTKLSVGLINKESNEMEQPDGLYMQIFPNYTAPVLSNLDLAPHQSQPVESTVTPRVPQHFTVNAEQLDTVFLQTQSKQEMVNSREIIYDRTYIDKEMALRFVFITDYIEANGFRVFRRMGEVSIISTRSLGLRGPETPLIYIDGMPVLSEAATRLYRMKTKDVKYIQINRTGLGYGLRGEGGVIKIKTRMGSLYGGEKKDKNVRTVLAGTGYASKRDFYRPKYTNYQSEFFEDYGVIDWFSEVRLNDSGVQYLDVFNSTSPKVRLYIEGMAKDGTLVSEEFIVDMD